MFENNISFPCLKGHQDFLFFSSDHLARTPAAVTQDITEWYLKGANIDYIDSLMGSGFKINNPNVTKSCSCGHSFSTE